jgi:hypothetical protein
LHVGFSHYTVATCGLGCRCWFQRLIPLNA